jgi:hypothetical protein
MRKLCLEETLVLVFVLILTILGIILYFYPTQFFMIYDKILFFILR